MSLTQVRESPHITEPNAEAHTGEHVLGFAVPLGPVPCLLLHPVQILMSRDPIIQSRVRKYQSHGHPTQAEKLHGRR